MPFQTDSTGGTRGMAKLWHAWMRPTAEYLVQKGYHMPLLLDPEGKPYGQRALTAEDCHQGFTAMWLGVDRDGQRLSWSEKPRAGMRPATPAERYRALLQHEHWATVRGIQLPRNSEFRQIKGSP